MRKPTKRQRRKATQEKRELAKSRPASAPRGNGVSVSAGDAFTAGLVLAEVLPTHPSGEWRLGSGWVSTIDTVAWHECAHAVASLQFGWRVVRLSIEDFFTRDLAGCDFETSGDINEPVFNYRRLGVGAWAGAVIVAAIRRDALRLPTPLQQANASPRDRSLIEQALPHIPETDTELQRASDREALRIVTEHTEQFGALVAALLEHQTLDEAQVRAVWESADPEAARTPPNGPTLATTAAPSPRPVAESCGYSCE